MTSTPPPGAHAADAVGGSEALRLTPTSLAIMGVVLSAFVGVFWYWLYVQNFQSWNNSEDWGHAYFVPFVSLYLLWHNRAELARVRPRTFAPGALAVLLGLACYFLFSVSALNNHMVRGGALILTLWGLILWMGGPALSRVTFWPVAYLVFAITISEKVVRDITFALQLASSQGAYGMLNVLGVQCELNGNVIEVSTKTGSTTPLNVAEACAGMRMVIGFVALGAAVALVGVRYWWQRVVLIMLAVPTAILMNIVRVVVLGFATLKDPELAKGQAHMFVGTVTLIPAFLIYMGVAWALNMAVSEGAKPKGAPVPGLPDFWRPGSIRWGALARPAVLLPVLVLASAAVAIPGTVAYLGIHLKKQPIYPADKRAVQAIPTETESWTRIGQDVVESAEMVAELGTPNYLTRAYVERRAAPGARPRVVQLHLAYYTGMIDTIPHVPERCMVGGGMQITGAGTQVLPVKFDRSAWRTDTTVTGDLAGHVLTGETSRGSTKAPDGRIVSWSDQPGARVRLPRNVEEAALRVTEFADPKGTRRLYAGYFFVANGSVTDSAENVRLLAFDRREYYAYYLKVQVSGEGFAGAQELVAAGSSLLSELFPEIMRTVPDWVEVDTGRYPEGNPRAKNAQGDGKKASLP